MSYYKDHRIKITPTTIRVGGVPFPIISSIIFERADLESLRAIDAGLLNRLVVNGPTSLDTWSCYDPFSVIRSQAVVLTLNEPLGTFKHLVLTFSDFDAAMSVLRDEYAEIIVS